MLSPSPRVLLAAALTAALCLLARGAPPGPAHMRHGKKAQVYCIALSPDGTVLASGGTDSRVRFWDVKTGRQLARSAEHDGNVMAVCFSPDGKTLASAGGGGTIYLWDAATAREICRLAARRLTDRKSHVLDFSPVRALAFSPDGRILASGGGFKEDCVRLWDVAAGRSLRDLPPQKTITWSLAFSPDGRTLARGGAWDPVVRLWEVATARERARFPTSPAGPTSAVFLPGGNELMATAVFGGGNGPAGFRVWHLATSKDLRHFGDPLASIARLALAADGRILVTAGWDQTIRLWDPATGKLVRCLRAKDQEKTTHSPSIALSRDGRVLTVADTEKGIIRFWNPASGREWRTFGERGLEAVARPVPPAGKSPGQKGKVSAAAVGPLRPADLEALWGDLAGADARKAYRAIWTLAGAPGQTVPLLRPRLGPALGPTPQELDRLIRALDDDRFAIRRKATAKLSGLGPAAEPALRDALGRGPPLELRRRIEQILRGLERAGLSAHDLRALRAVETLEHIGTSPAKQILQSLSRGAPTALLTREAKASLGRLTR